MRKLRYVPGIIRTYRNPVLRVMDYLGRLPPGQLVPVRLRNGLTFQIRAGTSDFGVLDDIFLRGVYDRALSRLGPGDVVADVGAQCGGFALGAATRAARVMCFEPVAENCELLRQNARLNGLEDRIVVHQMAVAGLAGRRSLHYPPGDTGGATLVPLLHPEWTRRPVHQMQVECVTLHEVVRACGPAGCACFKMDCEGAEFEIIAAAEATDLQAVAMMIMEYHPNGDPARIVERMEGSGFTVKVRRDPAVLFATRGR